MKDKGPSPLDAKYISDGYNKFLDKDGYPAIQPPWGTLTAIDLNSGKTVWKIPLGEYPELAAKGLTGTGSENYGGPVVTAGGLLFIGATNYDKVFRALDKTTGKVLWQTTLPAAGNATPSTYEVNGRQYIVIAAGGGKSPAPSGGSLVAFALPEVKPCTRSGFSATMQRMLTRRTFVSMTAASLAARALAPGNSPDRQWAIPAQAGPQFSVMIWTLNKLGTFDENLERVAQAGYHHVELVGEFKKWSEEDYRRILGAHADLEDLGGCDLWREARLRGSLRRGCVSHRAKGSHPGSPAVAVQADHSALG